MQMCSSVFAVERAATLRLPRGSFLKRSISPMARCEIRKLRLLFDQTGWLQVQKVVAATPEPPLAYGLRAGRGRARLLSRNHGDTSRCTRANPSVNGSKQKSGKALCAAAISKKRCRRCGSGPARGTDLT